MAKMKYLPTDVSSFKVMMEGNYVYVDKTEYIYHLFNGGNRYYFLARPRRFGKSLLVSTIKEIFLGNRKLFKGLWIDSSDYQWQEYPVIHIDFSLVDKSSPEEFKISLSWELEEIARKNGADVSEAPIVSNKFKSLIEQLSKKNKVVILIDEYDKPILDAFPSIEQATAMRTALRGFYEIIKGMDEYIRAIFITGVTKFAKTSIFSGLNNLADITMNEMSATLFGYTKHELEHYFDPYIQELALHTNQSKAEAYEKIKNYYNGYRFSEKEQLVYNPFSVLYCLYNKKFENYWFASGTPSFLIEMLRQQGIKMATLDTIEIAESSLGTFDITSLDLFPILFQTGYLTIKEYHAQDNRYILEYPNTEVKDSFIRYLAATFSYYTNSGIDIALSQFRTALHTNNIDFFCSTLQSLLANIPYQLHIGNEAYYHSLLQFLITLLGLEGHSEISTSKGRIDMMVEVPKHVIIFELKFGTSAHKALAQIVDHTYYEKYLYLKKPITLVGLSFNLEDKELVLDSVTKEL